MTTEKLAMGSRQAHIDAMQVMAEGEVQFGRSLAEIIADAALIGEAALYILGSRASHLLPISAEEAEADVDNPAIMVSKAISGSFGVVTLLETTTTHFAHQRICDLAIGLPESQQHASRFRPPFTQTLFAMQKGETFFPMQNDSGREKYNALLTRAARSTLLLLQAKEMA